MTDYLRELDKHLCAVEQGNVEEMYDIKDFAEILSAGERSKKIGSKSPVGLETKIGFFSFDLS